MDYTKKSPVILSLCTGGRGLERGLERAFEVLGNGVVEQTAEKAFIHLLLQHYESRNSITVQ